MKIFKDDKWVGKVEFLKNKNMYSVTFHDDTHYANTLVSVNGLDEYLDDMGFQNENEVFINEHSAGR